MADNWKVSLTNFFIGYNIWQNGPLQCQPGCLFYSILVYKKRCPWLQKDREWINLAAVDPFIYITSSKPLMSSGSWLTLHNCEFFCLLAVNYDPATTDLIFIRVNEYLPRAMGGGLTADFVTHSFYKGHYLPCVLTPQY